MNLLGEVTVEEETYEDGWTGFGAAINDEGEEAQKTLIAASFDNFMATNTLNVAPPTIDELTAAINAGSMDSRFDIDGNGEVDSDDRTAWVTDIGNTYFGDANLDGEFNSGDMVQVFVKGKYETGETAGWEEGDWNGRLYRARRPGGGKTIDVALIPYYAWANRGVSEMTVWMPPVPGREGFARFDITPEVEKGLTFRPLAVTAQETLEYHFSRPPERQAELRAGLSAEREAEVLAAWRSNTG